MNADTLSLTVAETLLRTHRARAQQPRPAHAEQPHGAIAVSREAGAAGETIARAVGERLGCPVYSREIVERIAEELQRPAEEVQRLDERPTTWIEDWLTGMPGTPPQISMDTYMRYLYPTIRGMAELQRCVIVGRGAPYILRPDQTLRVRVVADRADRVQRVMKWRDVDERTAVRWLEATDAERARFVRRYFGVDPTDPHHYDLVLNSSRQSIAECATAIVDAFARLDARVSRT